MTQEAGLRARTVALATVLLVSSTIGLPLVTTAPAHAAARVSVTSDQGSAVANRGGPTTLRLEGSGFQSVRGGFGGVYVMFGWVSDAGGGGWKPSQGGITGTDYRYVPDSESADNRGYMKFVSFPGGPTAGEAHAVLSDSGGFSLELVVPGPTFQSVDRDGAVQSVDCTQVTCGVITVGAHGVKNPANETFTPVRFEGSSTQAPGSDAPEDSDDPATPGAGAAPTPGAGVAPSGPVRRAAVGKPQVVADRRTAQAGKALAFTGGGFWPGEQVVGVLGDGVAAIGPMQAGATGEVAGVLELPADLEPGTHELRLTGAGSGIEATERFAIRPGDELAPATSTSAEESAPVSSYFLVGAAVVFAIALVSFVVGVIRRRAHHNVHAG